MKDVRTEERLTLMALCLLLENLLENIQAC